MSITISLTNISKCFKRYAHPVDRLKELLLPGKSRADNFWALQEINLEVDRGETLGIIGQNGSGKSTLLQIIAGTLTPTTGEVGVNGRVSALLELGSGFNPEFTGEQNIFFNGRILGLSREQIEEKFDSIAAFADIGKFIKQPVKTYSSGMVVRLAFAVAVSVTPEILIVDEALAVGDIYFQQKCFERIRELKELGTTLLFVSHESGSVCRLCNRAILLESGKLVFDAKPKQVVDLYEAKLLKKKNIRPESIEVKMVLDSLDVSKRAKTEKQSSNNEVNNIEIESSEVAIKFVKLLDEQEREIESIISEDSVKLAIGVLFIKQFEDPHIGFRIRSQTGEIVFATNTYCMGEKIGAVNVGELLTVSFKFDVPLREGEYTITVGIAESGFGEGQFKQMLAWKNDVALLKVFRNRESIIWAGIVNLAPSVSIQKQIYV